MDIRDSLTEDGLNVHRMLFDRIQEIKHLSPFIDLYELNGQFFLGVWFPCSFWKVLNRL